MKTDMAAIETLKAKALSGNMQAQIELGDIFKSCKYESDHKIESLKWYLMAAKQESSYAQYEAARILEDYEERDTPHTFLEKAFDLYRKSANHDYSPAQYRLGLAYEFGIDYYDLFCNEEGDAVIMIHRDIWEAIDWYEKACKQGNAHAEFRLGYIKLRTIRPTDKNELLSNDREAYRMILSCACHGVKEAFQELSFIYDKGLGVKQNPMESYIWARMAMFGYSNISKECEYFKELEVKLSKKERIYAQDVAIQRYAKWESSELTVEYCLEAATSNLRIDYKKPVPNPYTPKHYNGVSEIELPFQKENVKLELIIDMSIPNDSKLDYDTIIITYDGNNPDRKSRGTYEEPEKVFRPHRELLICLACQAPLKKDHKSIWKQNIKDILAKDSKNKGYAGRLNTMFLKMFPGCGLGRSNSLIDFDNYNLKVVLDVTRSNILDSKTCTECNIINCYRFKPLT